jgi:hypothetical protein
LQHGQQNALDDGAEDHEVVLVMKVLIVGSKGTVSQSLGKALKCFEPDFHISSLEKIPNLNKKESFVGYRGVLIEYTDNSRLQQQLSIFEKHNYDRPIVIFADEKPPEISSLIATGRVAAFLAEKDIIAKTRSCFERIIYLFKNGETQSLISIEEEYRRLDNSSLTDLGAIMVARIKGEVTYANSALSN